MSNKIGEISNLIFAERVKCPVPYIKNFFCICCDGNENFKNCPLCDDERIFEDECNDTCEDFMRDFYSETVLTMGWCKKSEEDKKKTLDDELTKYFGS